MGHLNRDISLDDITNDYEKMLLKGLFEFFDWDDIIKIERHPEASMVKLYYINNAPVRFFLKPLNGNIINSTCKNYWIVEVNY